MKSERSDKWVRAYVGGTAVVDSRAPVLFYEDSEAADTSQRAEQLALTFTYFKRELMN